MRSLGALSSVKELSSKRALNCATLLDGHVKCWIMQHVVVANTGTDWAGTMEAPALIANVEHATSVANGDTHGCALIDDGSVKCWGGNALGELGVARQGPALEALTVPGVTNAVAIAAGAGSTCAVVVDG